MHKDLSSLSAEELGKLLRKESPEVVVMLSDLLGRLRAFSGAVAPWARAVVDGRGLRGLPVAAVAELRAAAAELPAAEG